MLRVSDSYGNDQVVLTWEVDFNELSELKPASVNLDFGNNGALEPLSWVGHRMVIGRKIHGGFHLFTADALNLVQWEMDRQVPSRDSLLDLQPLRQARHQNLTPRCQRHNPPSPPSSR